MKSIYTLLLIALISLSSVVLFANSNEQTQKILKRVEEAIKSLKPGMTVEEVAEIMGGGRPPDVGTTHGYMEWYYTYPDTSFGQFPPFLHFDTINFRLHKIQWDDIDYYKKNYHPNLKEFAKPFTKIKVGMSRDEIINIVGEPSRIDTITQGYEDWHYYIDPFDYDDFPILRIDYSADTLHTVYFQYVDQIELYKSFRED